MQSRIGDHILVVKNNIGLTVLHISFQFFSMHVNVTEIILYMPFKCQRFILFLVMMVMYAFCKNFLEKGVENRQKSKAENENHI